MVDIFTVCSLSQQWAVIGWEQAFGYIHRFPPDKPIHIYRFNVPVPSGSILPMIAIEDRHMTFDTDIEVLDNPAAVPVDLPVVEDITQ